MSNSRFILAATPTPEPVVSPCDPSPCGDNAECSELGRAAACKCLPGFQGDPYLSCRPECVLNTDCPSSLACINAKCKDPCPGTCGINAVCNVLNHVPKCSCLSGYVGDPSRECHLPPSKSKGLSGQSGSPVVRSLPSNLMYWVWNLLTLISFYI